MQWWIKTIISFHCLQSSFIFMSSCNCGGYTSVWIERDVEAKVAKMLQTSLVPPPPITGCCSFASSWWCGISGDDLGAVTVVSFVLALIPSWPWVGIYAAYICRQGRIYADICSQHMKEWCCSTNRSDPTLSVLSIMWEEETVNVLHRKPGKQSTLTTAVHTLDRPVLNPRWRLKNTEVQYMALTWKPTSEKRSEDWFCSVQSTLLTGRHLSLVPSSQVGMKGGTGSNSTPLNAKQFLSQCNWVCINPNGPEENARDTDIQDIYCKAGVVITSNNISICSSTDLGSTCIQLHCYQHWCQIHWKLLNPDCCFCCC